MVKRLFFLAVLMVPAMTFAQRLQFGLKANLGLSTNVQTNSRDYYFPLVDEPAYHIGGIDATTAPAIEFFARYDHYDRYFFQYGIGGYTSDYTISRAYRDSNEPYEIESVNLQQYIAAGRILSPQSLVKPYVSVGIIANSFLGYSNAHAYDNGDPIWEKDESIINDMEDNLKPLYLMGRVALGAKFYALHMELVFARNITPLDTSDDKYYKSIGQMQFSIGYNFLSFNTVKKKNI